MRIIEIFADSTGETHFRNVALALALRDFAPPSAPMGVSPETPLTTGVFLELPPGWDPTPHASPRPQWVVVLRGHLNITTTDGATTEFRPGDVFFLNDQDSKGHLSLVQEREPVGLLLVGLADIPRPQLGLGLSG
jgi:quercetin dioxygenase-like cupin family protein